MDKTETTSIPTQKQRWVKYGVNVGVLLLAVVAIVAIVNFMAYQNRQRLDFTHNRRYTLSPQTLRVLQQLDKPVTITTLYREGSVHAEKLAEVRTLLAEYDLRGRNIVVRHIDPARDIGPFERFTQDLLNRFSDQVEQRRNLVAAARSAITELRDFTQTQGPALTDLAAALPEADQRIASFIQNLDRFFRRAPDDLATVDKELAERFTGAMPDFEQARPLIQALDTYAGVLDQAVEFYSQLINRAGTPDAANDILLGLRDQSRAMNETLRRILDETAQVSFGRYEEIRSQLQRQNCVIVTVEQPAAPAALREPDPAADHRGVALLTIEELYPEYITTEQAGGGQRPQQTYKGEEQITGALLKLTLRHSTRVVFVNPSPAPALMGRGQQGYQIVTQRLRAMNFEVDEWQPGGGQMFGRPTPPQPRPEAREGQTLIFIALPPPPPNPQMPINPAADLAGEAIKDHIAAGRPVLVMSTPASAFMMTPESSPMLEPLKEFGISVEPDKMVVVPMPGRERGGLNQFEIAAAPVEHPIARAIRGLPGVMVAAQPVRIDKKEGVEAWPLLLSPVRSWADPEAYPPFPQTLARLTQDVGEQTGPITLAAAAAKGEQRIVVVAEPIWATDEVTGSAAVAMAGPSIADISLYSRFPANADLFVNSIYWLAGMDDLIAPGAKSQETRRIGDLSLTALSVYRWLLGLGLPAACLAAGVGVWFVRRR